jgi:hypothetical protein
MKNGRCRTRGGKCRGPATEEGRARISAALDKGRMRGKQWLGFNDTMNRTKRQGRVYRAMLDALMLVSDIAPSSAACARFSHCRTSATTARRRKARAVTPAWV